MNIGAPKVHSEPPRNQQAPLTQKTGYIQEMSGPLLMYGMNGLVLEPLLIAEEEEDEHHRTANQMVVEIALQESEFVAQFD
jgi:hypothetical protein